MNKCKKVIAFAGACVLLMGGALSFKADAASIQPRLSTHYCPTHGKALVHKGEAMTTVCSSCGKACTILYYICPNVDSKLGECFYNEYRCNKCGAQW